MQPLGELSTWKKYRAIIDAIKQNKIHGENKQARRQRGGRRQSCIYFKYQACPLFIPTFLISQFTTQSYIFLFFTISMGQSTMLLKNKVKKIECKVRKFKRKSLLSNSLFGLIIQWGEIYDKPLISKEQITRSKPSILFSSNGRD